MKKLLILFLCLITIQSVVKADDDKPIDFNQLPQQSQLFIKKYFADKCISLVKMENAFFDKSYEVIFSDGNKVDFNKKGEWKDVDCRQTELPQEIVPSQIKNYVTKNYPDVKIIEIEKEDGQKHEIKLSNGLDLTFDSKFNLVDIDD